MSSYIKTIPRQVGYPPLQVFEIYLVCHDGQNLPSRAPVLCIVVTFGQTFHQGGVDSSFFKLCRFNQGREQRFRFPRGNLVQACMNSLPRFSSIKPFCPLRCFCPWRFQRMADWTLYPWKSGTRSAFPWARHFFLPRKTVHKDFFVTRDLTVERKRLHPPLLLPPSLPLRLSEPQIKK